MASLTISKYSSVHSVSSLKTETENKDENKTNSDVDVITSVAMGDITFDFKTKTSDFLNQIDKGNLLEYAEFVGNLYGTPKDKVEENID